MTIGKALDKHRRIIMIFLSNVTLHPIGMYRAITRELIDYDKEHKMSELPLLFYAGQTVHTPDDDEIEKDFRTLCTEQDIITMKNKILKLKR